MAFLQVWLHKTFSLLIYGMRSPLCLAALLGDGVGLRGCGMAGLSHFTCNFWESKPSYAHPKAYRQMPRHPWNVPAFAMPVTTPEMPFFQAFSLVTFSHLLVAAELQQPSGHKSGLQPMAGVSDQEQTVAGVTCQISKLTTGLGNGTLLFDSCTWPQVRHHSEDLIM